MNRAKECDWLFFPDQPLSGKRGERRQLVQNDADSVRTEELETEFNRNLIKCSILNTGKIATLQMFLESCEVLHAEYW